jgi:hypothetical protein
MRWLTPATWHYEKDYIYIYIHNTAQHVIGGWGGGGVASREFSLMLSRVPATKARSLELSPPPPLII